MADVIGADAFTLNKQIYFGKGKYQPTTRTGQRLLAHEIAHANQDLPADTIYMSPGDAKGARQKILEETRVSQSQNPSDAILNILDGLGQDELEFLQSLLSSDLDNIFVNSTEVLCHVVYIDIPQRLAGYASFDIFQDRPASSYGIQPQRAASCISEITGNSPEEVRNALPMTPEEEIAMTAKIRQTQAEQQRADEKAKTKTKTKTPNKAQPHHNAARADNEREKFCTAQRNKAKGKPGSWEEQSYYMLVGDGTCPHPDDIKEAQEVFAGAGKYLTDDNMQVENIHFEPEERGTAGLRGNLFWRYASPKIDHPLGTLRIMGEASVKTNSDFFGKNAWVTGGPKFGGITSKGEDGKRTHSAGGRMELLGNNLLEGETDMGSVAMKYNLSAGVALLPDKAKPAFIASAGAAIGGEKWEGFGSITYIQPKTIEGRLGIKFKIPKDVFGRETLGDLAATGLVLLIFEFDKSKAAELITATAAAAAAAAAASESAGAAIRAEHAQAKEEGIYDALLYGGGLAAAIVLAPTAVAALGAMLGEASAPAAAMAAPAALAFLLDDKD